MLVRRWVARCDEPGCPVIWVAEAPLGDKWDAGIELTDAGWDCGPSWEETYCPDHHHTEP